MVPLSLLLSKTFNHGLFVHLNLICLSWKKKRPTEPTASSRQTSSGFGFIFWKYYVHTSVEKLKIITRTTTAYADMNKSEDGTLS